MVTTFYPPYNFGGDGVFVYRLSNELARRGHHVEVIHCIDSYRLLSNDSYPGNYDNHPNIKVHGLKSRYGFLSPLSTQLTGSPLLKSERISQVLENGFDVIHFHNISLVGGPNVLRYGKGIKLLTVHDYWLVCPTHVLFKFNRAACIQPQCSLCTLSYKRPIQLWRHLSLMNDSIKNVDALISPTKFAIETHRRFGLKAPMVHLEHFAPSSDEDLPIKDKILDDRFDKPFFLFIGRLEKLKGIHTVIPLFRNYNKSRLLIAGAGSYEPHLRKLAAGSDNIIFLGFLTDQQLKPLIANALAVIAPSLCYEISSLVIMEAFSQMTPVIARKIGAMIELVQVSDGGVLYETDDELLEAMDQMIEDNKSRWRMGVLGYEAYKKYWTSEIHINNYFDLINRLAENSQKNTISTVNDFDNNISLVKKI